MSGIMPGGRFPLTNTPKIWKVKGKGGSATYIMMSQEEVDTFNTLPKAECNTELYHSKLYLNGFIGIIYGALDACQQITQHLFGEIYAIFCPNYVGDGSAIFHALNITVLDIYLSIDDTIVIFVQIFDDGVISHGL